MVSGALTYSRTTQDGFRQQSAFEGQNLSGGVDWFVGGATKLTFRASLADQPLADNPGALDAAELAANRDSAPANNITRDATKDVVQQQYSATLTHYAASAEHTRDAGRLAAQAKVYASEAANRACAESLQIHGGNGFHEDYEISRLYRDVRVTTIYEGTSEMQRLVIARSLLQR